jgi:hypothetical protein
MPNTAVRPLAGLSLAVVLSTCCGAILPAAYAQIPVSKGRKLAPAAIETIEPAAEWDETALGPIDLPLVAANPDIAWDPNFAPSSDTLLEKSKKVLFRNDIYCLQFSFKPVRMIQVGGENIWYLLFRVRYKGGDLRPVPGVKSAYGKPKAVSAEWVRFMPTFRLDSLNLGQVYMDSVVPGAREAIAARERVGSRVYNTVELQRLKIKVSTETEDNAVWGVATWKQVDPRIDFFTVDVRGLTNAQKLVNNAGEIDYLQKSLILHFARPGDTINELSDRIRYGIPAIEDPARQKYVLQQYGQSERLDYFWDYR